MGAIEPDQGNLAVLEPGEQIFTKATAQALGRNFTPDAKPDGNNIRWARCVSCKFDTGQHSVEFGHNWIDWKCDECKAIVRTISGRK